jgi:hypothetical protein
MTRRHVTIEFLCRRCGLLTPGLAELPAEYKPHERVVFSVKCFHCGKPVTKTTTIAKAIRADSQGKP